MDRKIVTVLGARGAQGGGLVRAIMADQQGAFTARAVTRDVRSERAKELRALGGVLDLAVPTAVFVVLLAIAARLYPGLVR